MIEKFVYLICPFVSLLICILIKDVIEMIQNNKIDLSRILSGSGGMPSCHASFISSFTTLVGLKLGISSPLFSMALIFSLITCYDAINSRYQCGLQAKMLNKIVGETRFKEKLGHKKLEVFIGILIGIMEGIIFSNF